MNVPLPHASFPLGETISFTVELLTDETGKPWTARSLGQKDALELELRWGTDSYTRRPLEPVTAKPAAFTFLFNIGGGFARGLYRYSIRLCREKNNYGSGYAQTYTLLSGTFTLY